MTASPNPHHGPLRTCGPAHAGEPLHTCEQFAFIANAPLDVTWPLFGAEKERVWAPGWNPVFVWPATALDQDVGCQ